MNKYHLRILHSSAQTGCYFEETVIADSYDIVGNGNLIHFFSKEENPDYATKGGYKVITYTVALYPTSRTIVHKIEKFKEIKSGE